MPHVGSNDPRRNSTANLAVALVVLVACVVIFALAWKITPLAELASPEALAGRLRALAGMPAAPFLFVAVFVIGGFLVVPVVALILAAAILFPPGTAVLVSLTGVMLSAAVLYQVGLRFSGRIEALVGPAIPRLRAALARSGILAVMAVRMLPVAPFSIVNLAAGSIRVGFRDYLIGTALGMIPGIVALSFFGGQLRAIWEDPTPARILVTVVAALLWIGLSVGLQRWSGRRSRG